MYCGKMYILCTGTVHLYSTRYCGNMCILCTIKEHLYIIVYWWNTVVIVHCTLYIVHALKLQVYTCTDLRQQTYRLTVVSSIVLCVLVQYRCIVLCTMYRIMCMLCYGVKYSYAIFFIMQIVYIEYWYSTVVQHYVLWIRVFIVYWWSTVVQYNVLVKYRCTLCVLM